MWEFPSASEDDDELHLQDSQENEGFLVIEKNKCEGEKQLM